MIIKIPLVMMSTSMGVNVLYEGRIPRFEMRCQTSLILKIRHHHAMETTFMITVHCDSQSQCQVASTARFDLFCRTVKAIRILMVMRDTTSEAPVMMYFQKFGHSLTMVQAWLMSISSVEMTRQSDMVVPAMEGA